MTDALSMPSFQSIIPNIVERDQIAMWISLLSTQFNLSRILGPALAGILTSTVGFPGAFAVSSASYVPFILAGLWILPSKITGPSIAEVSARLWDGRVLGTSVCEVFNEHKLRGSLLTVFVSASLCAPLITF